MPGTILKETIRGTARASSWNEDSKSYLDITSDPNAKRPEYYLTLQ
jgi:hypothetical protein